jgi:hypothetical protein
MIPTNSGNWLADPRRCPGGSDGPAPVGFLGIGGIGAEMSQRGQLFGLLFHRLGRHNHTFAALSSTTGLRAKRETGFLAGFRAKRETSVL